MCSSGGCILESFWSELLLCVKMGCKTIRVNATSTAGRFHDDIHCVLPFSLALHCYLCNLVSHFVIEHILISGERRTLSASAVRTGSFKDKTLLTILIPAHNIAHQHLTYSNSSSGSDAVCYRAQGNGVLSRLTPLKHTNRFMLTVSTELEMIWFQGASLPWISQAWWWAGEKHSRAS